MIKVFISQPMRDRTDEEIDTERKRAIRELKSAYPDENFEFIDSHINYGKPPVWMLGRSIQLMSEADLVYFIGKWNRYTGCKIEHLIARQYDMKILEE